MNDFDYDIVQKKRVARGAFAHVNRKRGKCRLPSDYLTAAQKKEMNGAVKTYNITRPMPLDEFKGMPDDLQREYLRNMQSCGGAATYLADEMGCCSATIREYGEKLVVPPCKVGDRLYEVTGRKTISVYKVRAIRVELFGLFIEWDIVEGFVWQSLAGINAGEIGKTVFLTREEAEKALEAMKDEY